MARPGIVLLDADTLGDVSFYPLTRIGNLTIYPATSDEERISRISGREIVITNKVIIDRKVIDACPDLKLICIAATGMNNVDIDYARSKGIEVKNVVGYSTESVVQHTFSMLFYLMENLPYYNSFVKNGEYSSEKLFTHHGHPFHELAGKKYGIIGMGTIGKRVAEVATAFKAEVIHYSTSGKNTNTGFTSVTLDTLLKEGDIISVHCPLNEKTKDLISYEELRKMKSSCILLNVGRGGIINESDLASAIDEGLIAAAGIDVMTKEPPDSNNPLLHITQKDRLFISPHIAWASIESRNRLIQGVLENINQFLK